jgi:hypothetical protein
MAVQPGEVDVHLRAEGNAKPLDTVAEELLRLLPSQTTRPGRSGARRG